MGRKTKRTNLNKTNKKKLIDIDSRMVVTRRIEGRGKTKYVKGVRYMVAAGD